MKTYRYRGHSRSDPAKYRPAGELDAWKARDPIDHPRRQARRRGRALGRGAGRRSAPQTQAEIDAAAERAADGPLPDARGDPPAMSTLTEAATAASATGHGGAHLSRGHQRRARGRDGGRPSVVLMGEDVAADGGVFKTNIGLAGASSAGAGPHDAHLRERLHRRGPGHGHHRACARWSRSCSPTSCPRPATRSSTSCPSTATCRVGSSRVPGHGARRSAGPAAGFGTQHSATGESWFMAQPGMRVVTASSPGLGVRAAAGGDPQRRPGAVLRAQGAVRPQGPRRAGRDRRDRQGAPCVREGTDVTIVATLHDGRARPRRRGAARGRGHRAPRSSTCAGSDRSTCRPSAPRSRKTGRLVIAEEQWHEGGWGATIISELAPGGVAWKAPPDGGQPARTTCSSPTAHRSRTRSCRRPIAIARRRPGDARPMTVGASTLRSRRGPPPRSRSSARPRSRALAAHRAHRDHRAARAAGAPLRRAAPTRMVNRTHHHHAPVHR